MPDPFGLFVNRVNELMNFMELVHDDSATVSKTRYFHGEVGIGKTFLLDFLRNKLCYFQDWNFLKNKAQLAVGPELLRVLTREDFDKGSPKKLPVAYLDFSSAPSSTLTPQSTLPALLSLQHQLAEDGLRFPHFVYASMLFLVRNGEAGKELWNKGLPNDEMNLAQQTLSAISGEEVPFANLARAMIKVTEKIFGAKIGEKLRERKMDPDELKGLHSLDSRKPSLIEDELPRLFAKDLRHALTNSAHLRVLLFFDSHDAFWGVGEREISEYLFHARDEWFRRLLIHLKPEKKILVLIAGEEPPAWDQALLHPIPKADVELVPVGGIAEQDAHSYLSAAGVDS